VDSYEGSRSLDDLKNYLTLKISEYSLLSSATTENSESAEEIPSDIADSDMQVRVQPYLHSGQTYDTCSVPAIIFRKNRDKC